MWFPRDISQNIHIGPKVEGSKWRIMCVKEFNVSR